MKWLKAYYHALTAKHRVSKLERIVNRFNTITHGRLNNFNRCLDSVCRELQEQAKSHACTKELADYNADEIGRRELVIRDLESSLEAARRQIQNLSRALDIQNDAMTLLNNRLDYVHSELARRETMISGLFNPSVN